MAGRNFNVYALLFSILAITAGAVPIFAGPAVIGSVAGGSNATVQGQALLPHATLFSGDTLRVNDGVAEIAVDRGSVMVFGKESEASFDRAPEEVTIALGKGNVSVYHSPESVTLRVKAGDVSVLAVRGFKTLGEVAMVNGMVVVTAKEGTLRVQGPQRSMELTKGKSITIAQRSADAPNPQRGAGSTAAVGGGARAALPAISAGGAVAGATVGIVSVKKTGDAKTATSQTLTDASAAASSAAAAASAASAAASNAATAASTAATAATAGGTTCKAVSPTGKCGP